LDNYFDNNGRPLQKLTGEIWNNLFENEKTLYTNDLKSFGDVYWQAIHSMNLVINKEDSLQSCNPYADYLYSVLESFLNRQSDYCYYLYNIRLLLSIFGDALESQYLSENKCFEVWINESKLGRKRNYNNF
jgi:hypothetical protein